MSRNAEVSIIIQARDLTRRAVSGVRGRFQRLKSTLFSVQSAVIALGGTALVGLGKKLFNLGSEAEEVENRFRTVFGNLSDMMQQFIDDFAVMSGISDVEGKEMVATMGQIAQAMGFSREESAEFSKQIFKTAADLASFTDVPTRQALEDIQSGLAKMPRPLRKYGIMLSQAKVQQRALAMTGKANAKALTEQETAMATLALVTEEAGVAMGDNVRTQDSAARAAKSLGAALSNIATSLGMVVKTLTTQEGKLTSVRDATEEFDNKLRDNIATVTAWANVVAEFTSFVVKTVAEVFRAAFNLGQMIGNVLRVTFSQLVGHLGNLVVNPIVDMLNGLIEQANKLPGVNIDFQFAGIDSQAFFEDANQSLTALQGNANDLADSFTRTVDRAGQLGDAVAMAQISPQLFAPGTEAELPGVLDTPGTDAAAKKMEQVRQAGKELRGELDKIDQQSRLLGDEFNAKEEELKALESGIEKFAELGADANTVINDQGETVGDLVRRYQHLDRVLERTEARQKHEAAMRKLAADIMEDQGDAQDQFTRRQRVLNELLEKSLITTEAYNNELSRMQKKLLLSGDAGATMGEKIGAALIQATQNARTMDQVMADLITGTIQDFGKAIEGAFKAFVDGSKTAGEAFIGAMTGAIATVARKMGEYFMAQGLAALGMALVPPPLGSPTGAASAAKFFAAGAAMFALAGAIGGAGSRLGGGGGGGGGGAAADTSQQQEDMADKAEVVLNVEGSPIWDLSDPRTEQQVKEMLEELSDRRVVINQKG